MKVCDELEQIKDCDGVVLVFSVTDKSSFTWATTAIEKLEEKFKGRPKENGLPDQNGDGGAQETNKKNEQDGDNRNVIPVILVGNKVDDAKLSREVEEDSAKSLSEKFSCAGFFETAALCNADVPKAFNCLLSEIGENMKDPEEPIKPSNACCIIV